MQRIRKINKQINKMRLKKKNKENNKMRQKKKNKVNNNNKQKKNNKKNNNKKQIVNNKIVNNKIIVEDDWQKLQLQQNQKGLLMVMMQWQKEKHLDQKVLYHYQYFHQLRFYSINYNVNNIEILYSSIYI